MNKPIGRAKVQAYADRNGIPPELILDIEFHDGSHLRERVNDRADAWARVTYYDNRQEIKSAWLDSEPWFGDCTRDDIP